MYANGREIGLKKQTFTLRKSSRVFSDLFMYLKRNQFITNSNLDIL